MLRRYNIARLAFQHSPETEQRLLAYQSKDETVLPGNEGNESNTYRLPEAIAKVQSDTRGRLSFLNDLADIKMRKEEGNDVNNKILLRFFDTHQEFLENYFRQSNPNEIHQANQGEVMLSSLLQIFDKDLREIIGRSLDKLGPRYTTHLTDENFIQSYMRAILKLEKDAAIPKKTIQKFQEIHYVPNTFIHDGVIHFNMNHIDFDFEKKLKNMREAESNISEEDVMKIVKNNRNRAIIHEIGHYCLNRKDRDGSRWSQLQEHLRSALDVQELAEHPAWVALQEAVEKSFGGKFGKKNDIKFLHEAVAIWTAGKRIPNQEDEDEYAVIEKLDAVLNAASNDPFVRNIIADFERDVDEQVSGNGKKESSFSFAQRKMADASGERSDNLAFKERFEEEECGTFTNKPEADPLKKKIKEDLDNSESEITTSEQVISKIEAAENSIKKIRSNKAKFLSLMTPENREAEEKGLNALLDKFSSDMNDLSVVEEDAVSFGKWDTEGALTMTEKNALAKKFRFSDLGTYEEAMSESDVAALDEKNKEKRGEVLAELADLVTMHFEPIIKIADSLENAVIKQQESESKSSSGAAEFSIVGWIKRNLGKDGGVHWLSVYDLVKVYNIYKDAILERYHSKQKIRTYQAAKTWNVWAPLKPDLDKQAKSANDEETEKFKEYLKKDGFTYDQLFNSGGVLDKNRGNINRAKAVIDYAADHAWLYKLDRTNGFDVYGIDYEGNWGERTFEELVENNAAQQDKESKNGYSKVNNYPEIPLIIEDMIEELKKKNLWQVHGMMQRLQEKSKLAESNTMALTTLFRALREDPDVLELMDIGMLDKIGNIGIGQSAWALTMYKVQRKQILAMKNAVLKESTRAGKIHVAKNYSDKDADFVMGRAIKAIENRLPTNLIGTDKKGHPDFRKLDHEVAKVLAGQTIKDIDGRPLSIFDSEIETFNAYRKFYMDFTDTTPTDVRKTDPDFFNPGNGGSDLLLLGQNEVGNILGHQSQGPWIEESKANNFVTQIFMRDEELIKQDPSGRLRSNYRAEMKRKLTLYLNSKVLAQPAAMNYLAKVRTSASPDVKKFIDPKKISNKVILLELKNRGMIEESVFKKIRRNGSKDLDEKTVAAYLKDDPTFDPAK